MLVHVQCPSLARLHGPTDDEIDLLFADLVANAIWREAIASGDAPGTGDAHLWVLLASHPQAQLVTGDRLVIKNPSSAAAVASPRRFVETFLSPKGT